MNENDKKLECVAFFITEQENITKSINNNTKEKISVLNQNVFSFRGVLLAVTGFSLTIIGVILSILLPGNDIIGSQTLLFYGLLCFIINIILSVLFILNIYHFENNKVTEQIKFNNTSVKEINELLKSNFLQGKTPAEYLGKKQSFLEKKLIEENAINDYKNKNGLLIMDKDYTPHLIIALFLLGFVLTLLSFIKL